MKTFVLALDLKNDPSLIREYEEHHQRVWPEILHSIKAAGIIDCVIYRISNRLIMHLTTTDSFSFEQKAQMDCQNPIVQDWENLMWKYQQAIPGFPANEKWQVCSEIFRLNNHPNYIN